MTAFPSFLKGRQVKLLSRIQALRVPELATLSLLFLAGLLSRLPFSGQVLYHFDSINFALGLRKFDLTISQPHAPGYILYIYLGRLALQVFPDPQRALSTISMLGSALAVVLLYLVGREIYDRRTGLLAAALLATSPLFWFYSEVALPHALDALAVIASAWLFYRILKGEAGLAIPAAIFLGIAGGLRPQTEVFLAPLAVYTGMRLGWRRALLAGVVLGLVDLAWFLPLAATLGGPGEYLQFLGRFSEGFNNETSVFEGGLRGLLRNNIKLAQYTLYGMSLAVVPFLLGGAVWLRDSFRPRPRSSDSAPVKDLAGLGRPGAWSSLAETSRSWLRKNERVVFFTLWILPALGYYVFIHMGQQGLVFIFLPALLLLAAAGFFRLGWGRLAVGRLAAVAMLMANGLIFLAAPTYPLGGESPKLLNLDTLRQHDTYYQPRIQQIPHIFSPEHSILLAADWRFPQYYLSQYVLLPYGIRSRWEKGAGLPVEKDESDIDPAKLGLSPDQRGLYTLILLDDRLIPFNQTPDRVEWMDLGNGQTLGVIRFTSQERVFLSPTTYGIVPEPTATR